MPGADPGAGRPDARMRRGGFAFFTNYESRKGRELEINPFAAIVFFWHELERQVRAEGRVERTSEAESDAYFRGRPEGPDRRLGIPAERGRPLSRGARSPDPGVRATLSRRRGPPPALGRLSLDPRGHRVLARGGSRLHDRLQYRRHDGEGWRIERLSP